MCSKNLHLLIFLIFYSAFTAVKAVLNFEDEDVFGFTADEFDWTKHPCRRTCNPGDRRHCNYVFVVEQYSSMSKACYDCPFNTIDCYRPHCIPAEGAQKTIYTINRQLPGPKIEVCANDIVNIEVRNRMMSESTTIHWHGIDQFGTPFSDGVPYVTQCPILPGESYTYTFNATDSGTYFWHSHMGTQRADGFFGPLVVHSPAHENPQSHLYDRDEHSMIIIDWMNREGIDGNNKHFYEKSIVRPETILINGLGFFTKVERNNGTEAKYTPPAVFDVKQNLKYRFRLINAGSANCPIIMSIDNHKLLVISLDSNDIEPIEVDAITSWPGERVDFVVEANQPINNYWIRYRGFGLCQPFGPTRPGVYQVALLRYQHAPNRYPTEPIGYDLPVYPENTRILNPYNVGTESSHSVNITVPDLNALVPNDLALTKPVDQQIYLAFDFYDVDNYDFHRKGLYGLKQVSQPYRMTTLQINHITFKFPSFPPMSQWQSIGSNTFCNESHTPGYSNCITEHCVCTHLLQVKHNAVVELIFVDQGTTFVVNHPLHLHGHFFRVVAEVNLEGNVTIDRIKQLDKEGKIQRRLDRAPIKDTIKAPGGGYTIIRFHANNPGYWFFHCHFEEHSNTGMGLIIKVGEHEDMAPVPKGFPKCGNFAPINMTG